MDNFVAFIPVRGVSKSIPLKNICLFVGKTLVYWTIKATVERDYIQEVYASMYDKKDKGMCPSHGATKSSIYWQERGVCYGYAKKNIELEHDLYENRNAEVRRFRTT